jgi:hypothetical protein
LAEVSGRVLRGAIMFSSNILEVNLDLLRMSIVGIDGSFLRSFTIREDDLKYACVSIHFLLYNLACYLREAFRKSFELVVNLLTISE